MNEKLNPDTEKTDAQIGLKVTQTVKDRYEDVTSKLLDKDPNLTRNDIMARILDVAEVNLARDSKLVGAKEIKELDYHSSRMAQIYTNIIHRVEASDKEHRDNYVVLEDKLKNKEVFWLEKKRESDEVLKGQKEELERLQKANKEFETHRNELDGHLADKDRIIASLEEKCNENAQAKGQLKLIELENGEFEERIILLEKQMVESNHINASQADQVKRLNNDLEELKQENQELKSEKSAGASALAKSAERIDELIAQQRDFELELSKCNVKHSAAAEQIEFYKAELVDLKEERNEKKLEIKRLRKENADLVTETKKLQKN